MASQAIQHGFRLLTRDIDDFKDIPGLDLVVFGSRPTARPPTG
jgi:predicted nucleic acid-binding protein